MGRMGIEPEPDVETNPRFTLTRRDAVWFDLEPDPALSILKPEWSETTRLYFIFIQVFKVSQDLDLSYP
jgi:hypothetical protein